MVPETSSTRGPCRTRSGRLFAGLLGWAALALAATVGSPRAAAEEAHAASSAPGAMEEAFRGSLVLDAGRIEGSGPDKEALRFQLHGEYQARYRVMTDLPLTPPASLPGATTLGQNQYLYHWLRLDPRIYYRDKVALIAQIDAPYGLVVGDTTTAVTTARQPLDEQKFYGGTVRWVYLQYLSPIGVFRIGQQGSYWGMGILANDGDHPSMFGDYQGGAIVERLFYGVTPLGKGSPLVIVAAADMVLEDATARLVHDGDRAFQGVLAALYRKKRGEIGLYGVVRHQDKKEQSTATGEPFVDELTAFVIDASGRFDAPVPGTRAIVYGSFEGAVVLGSTDYVRSSYTQQSDPTAAHTDEKIRTYGGAATLGAVRVARGGDASDGGGGEAKETWGQVVGEVEMGYASGDADPYDGVTKRFTFEPNHNVGLVLFKQVMSWKTARASYNASDPGLVARPAPGVQLLPSNGGVFGATYLNPRATFRPRRWVDLKAGVLIAQTTADFVDPYHFGALGSPRNYDGGDARKHDLGLELDLGFDFRVPVDRRITLQLGAEGGVLFPGHAFDDAAGKSMPNQALLNTKLGAQF